MKNPLNILLLLATIVCAVGFFVIRQKEVSDIQPALLKAKTEYDASKEAFSEVSKTTDTVAKTSALAAQDRANDDYDLINDEYKKADTMQLMLVIFAIIFSSLSVGIAAKKR